MRKIKFVRGEIMKYFLDSAKLEEIDYAFKNYCIDGVTTNPKHIMLSGESQKYFLSSMNKWLKENDLVGKDVFPVSVEVNPHLSSVVDIYNEAKEIAALGENFVIKIPCIENGLIAAKLLEAEGIRTNVTLVFSGSQALAAGKLNAKFVSPFVGWKENNGENALDYIEQVIKIYNNFDFETEIIVAALRNGYQIAKVAELGADIVTCGLEVYKTSFAHPYTDYGMGVFQEAYDKTAK